VISSRVAAVFFLRELSPGVRSQRMAAMNERVLVEAGRRALTWRH
jgi:hypothetical protein